MSARASPVYQPVTNQSAINFSTSGDNIILSSFPGRQIKVYRLKLICAGATSITVKDGVGIVLDGPLAFGAGGGMVLDWTSLDMPPWYETSIGNALVINSSLAVQVGGSLDYITGL